MNPAGRWPVLVKRTTRWKPCRRAQTFIHSHRCGHGAGHARGLCVSRGWYGQGEESGQRAGQDHERLRRIHNRLFLVGYSIAYGIDFFSAADTLTERNGYELVKFFFLLTFAAAIPAIISGGIAERAAFYSQLLASLLLVSLVYPLFEGMIWNGNFGVQSWIESSFGASFHDFAGSVVVHAVGGWIALAGAIVLGPRLGRYGKDGKPRAMPGHNLVFATLGVFLLWFGWFGFNVMSAQTVDAVSGLVAVNSLMAMVGGILAALIAGKNDPGFLHNGPLAGLVAVCAGSDIMHPLGSLVVGGVAGALFVYIKAGKRAIELNPNGAEAHALLAFILFVQIKLD